MMTPAPMVTAEAVYDKACPILHAQKLVASSLDVICSIDLEGRFIDVSPASLRVWGYAPEELKGMAYIDLVIEADRPKTRIIAEMIMSGTEVTNFENRYRCKDGRHRPITWSARWDQEEQIMYCVARDATEKKEAEKRARINEERLYRAYKLSGIGWWEWVVERNSYYASDELYSMYGLDKGAHPEITFEHFFSLVHPDDREVLQQQLSRVHHCDQYEYSHRLIRPDGEEVILQHDVRVERDEEGNQTLVHGTTRNITRARKAQMELEESERRLAQYSRRLTNVLESLEEGFFTVDRNWTVTYWNRKAEEHLLRKRESVLQKNLWAEFADALSLKFFSEYHYAMANGVPVNFEEYYPARDIWVEVHAYPNEEGLSVFFRDITRRKAQEEELRISNERFSFVSQATSDVIWDWDLQTREVHINASFSRVFGYPSEGQDVGRIWSENIHPEDYLRVSQHQLKTLRNESANIWEDRYRFMRSDGTLAYVSDRAVIIRDARGRAIRMIGAIQDITRQREAELEVERREKQFRAMVQSGKDLIALADEQFSISFISPNYEEVIGYSIDELKGAAAYRHIHPDDFNRVLGEARRIFDQATVHLPPFRFQIASGEYRWAEVVLTNHLKDPDIRAVIINARDITLKKQAFDEVQKLSMVAEQTSSSVVILGPDARIQWVNASFVKRTEYTLEEVIGKRPVEFLHCYEGNEGIRDYIQQCIDRQTPIHCELINVSKSGRRHWVELKGQPIFDEKGELAYFLSTQEDITRRKEAEEAIRRSEANYKLLFYKSPTPKWIFHAQTNRFTDVNDAALKLYGYTREEFLSMHLFDIRPPEERKYLQEVIDKREQRGKNSFSGILRHRTKSGRPIMVQVNSQLMNLNEEEQYIVEVHDMTEKMELEQMVIAEKIAAEKEVAKAIIATQEQERSEIGKELHDNVNQILTTAKLYVENIHYFPEQQEQFVEKSRSLLQKSINEVRALSKALVTPTIRDIGFRETLQELVDYYQELQLFLIDFEFALGTEEIDRGVKLTLYRIIQELFNNAIKHAKASRIRIRLEDTGGRIALAYCDDGAGFDPGSRKAGLGLSNIKNRAEVYRGIVKVESAPGQGCCVEVTFPRP